MKLRPVVLASMFVVPALVSAEVLVNIAPANQLQVDGPQRALNSNEA